MSDERLKRQIRFLVELDALKRVERRSYLADGSRLENSAEHSWHVAMLALVLAEHADEPLDVGKVIRMMLVHDIVEIDAGDTFRYDDASKQDAPERERRAADRLFGLLPADQGRELRDLWEEFEAGESSEARFAAAVDRLMPLLQGHATRGRTWREHGITEDRVLERNRPIAAASKRLWELARGRIAECVEQRWLARPGESS